MSARSARLRLAAALLTALAAATPVALAAADAARGRALYEARCVDCHDRSVHGRSVREARDFDQIRDWVRRWDAALGPSWTPSEIDDVARYLNERYYRYDCPQAICGGGRAVAPAPPATARR